MLFQQAIEKVLEVIVASTVIPSVFALYCSYAYIVKIVCKSAFWNMLESELLVKGLILVTWFTVLMQSPTFWPG